MNPLVSIIIPCYNAEPWLAETLASCFHQTHRNLEIIVIDNGSMDESLAVAKSCKDSRLIVTTCARKRASAARNVGLSLARGEYIQFLDADDLLAPDKIEIQVKRLASEPPGTVASGAWARFGLAPYATRAGDAVFKPEPVWRDSRPADFLITSWLGGGMMPLYAWLTPRPVITAAGPWNEELSVNDDGEFFARVILQSKEIDFCEQAKGYYRTHASASLSGRRDEAAIKSEFESIRLSSEHLLAARSDTEARRACAAAYQRAVYHHYPKYLALIRQAEHKVSELGGTDLPYPAGGISKAIEILFGWKALKRLQLLKWKVKRGA